MKIQVVQMKSICGKFRDNVDLMLKEIDRHRFTADVIVFPELCISGSMIMDDFKRSSVIKDLLAFNQEIIDASHDIMVVWGNVNLVLDELYNSGYVAYNQKLIFVSNKHFMSTANLRYIKKYFSATNAKELETFEMFDKKMAIVINNDFMTFDYQGIDIIFHLNTHYYRLDDTISRKLDFVNGIQTTFISCNAVGIVNANKYFGVLDGQSFVKHNQQIAMLNSNFEHESRLIDLDHFEPTKSLESISLLDVLVFAIAQIDQEVFSFKPQWIVGLSGGLDSSVVAALLVLALGKDRVVGYNLSTKYNSETTISNAYTLAETLGFEYHQLDITPLVEASIAVSQKEISGLALENVQARIRGHMLMTMASLVNGVVSNNSNKIESALGYGTLYGDTAGALGILADCTKMEVVSIARQINQRFKKEVIHENLLPEMTSEGLRWDFAPSAELRDNQTDPMKWGYHDFLVTKLISQPNAAESILAMYLDKQLFEGELGIYLNDYGLSNPQSFIDDFQWVINSMNKAVFKRIQSVPCIVVSNSVLGLDNQENQMPLVLSDQCIDLFNKINEEIKV